MYRITDKILLGLVKRMAFVMGRPLLLQKGSASNGISWTIETERGNDIVRGKSARELFDRAHAFIAGWYACEDANKRTANRG